MAKKENKTPDTETQTQVLDPETDAEVAVEAEAVPAVKTKKELKKERKEIKKHKKEVKKEAKRHSAKRTSAQNFFLVVLTILVIISMVFCSVSAIMITMGIGKTETAASDNSDNASSNTSSSSSSNSSSSSSNTANTPAVTPNESTSGTSSEGAPAAPGDASSADLSTKEGVVEYYKAAHAKVLSSAKSATHAYNNTLNYNNVLEIGGNNTLAKVAQSLMNSFMKEETNLATYTGSDIAAKFPGEHVQNLTADMLAEATCVEEGDNYIITLKVDSTEENPDKGEKTGAITAIINEKEVTDAAGSMVTLAGLENRYVGATVKATIQKSTGNMIAFESDVPSYMCFSEAKVAIISVKDCRIGLEYLQKWTMEY